MRQKGFIPIFIVLILMILIGGGVYYFGLIKGNISGTPTQTPVPVSTNSRENYVKGEVVVIFNNGVTESEASFLLQKYNLRFKNPENFRTYVSAVFKAREGDLDMYAGEIKKLNLPIIRSVAVYGRDRGNVQPWITVDFEPRASKEDIAKILSISNNLYIDESYPDTGDLLTVPAGKENVIIEQLLLEKIVKSASLNYYVFITN